MEMESSQLKQKEIYWKGYQDMVGVEKDAVESTEGFEARFGDRQGHTESQDLRNSMATFS